MRTTRVERGTPPYAWNVPSEYQCTWFSFYSAEEEGKTAPCYQDRATRSGSYNNAKTWLDNFREPWQVKDTDYNPVSGDIAVFDGQYGHVIRIIDNQDGVCTCSEYRSGDENSFRVFKWTAGTTYTGALLGYLHYPYKTVDPVERNEDVDQIQCSDTSVRIRDAANLEGDIVGHVMNGFYNVLSQKQADGYTWYEIAKGRYCANIGTTFLPANGESELIKQLEEYMKTLKKAISDKDSTINDYRQRMDQIHKLSE